MRIPKILHRCVPADVPDPYAGWWQRWLDLHPEWETRTHVNHERPEDFPETSPLWPLCSSGAMVADLARVEAVYREGGVYVDWDFEPFRPIDPLLDDVADLGLDSFFGSEDGHWLANAIFGAVPRSPIIRELLDALLVADLSEAPNVATGPHLLTRLFGHRRDEIFQVPSDMFFPLKFHERERKGEDFSQSGAFAVHWWSWTWRGTVPPAPPPAETASPPRS